MFDCSVLRNRLQANECLAESLMRCRLVRWGKQARCTQRRANPTDGMSIPFPARKAYAQSAIDCLFINSHMKHVNTLKWCLFPKKTITVLCLALARDFSISTLGAVTPAAVANSSVTGRPIAVNISKPVRGRSCFLLHLKLDRFGLGRLLHSKRRQLQSTTVTTTTTLYQQSFLIFTHRPMDYTLIYFETDRKWLSSIGQATGRCWML